MTKFHSTRIVAMVMLTTFFALGLTANTSAQVKIMPLGDSITRGVSGATDDAGYRNDLASLLAGGGLFFNFVGSQVDGSGFDPSHEGHDGFRADQIRDNVISYLNGAFTTNETGIIILMVGTNDISSDQTPETTRDEIEGIIDAIHAYNANLKIILSSVVPRTDEKDAQTTSLNNLIEALFYKKRDDEGRNLFYAGSNEVFKQNAGWAVDYFADSVHPNDTGYNQLAEVFFNAVMVAFNSTSTEVTDNFQRVSLGTTWDADPEVQIQSGDLANTATSGGGSWDQMATYRGIKNPTSIAVKWAADADVAGLTEAGLALLLNAATKDADGYLAWISPADNQLRLWTINNGSTDQDLLASNPSSQASPPGAGDILQVDVAVTLSNIQFDYYVNTVFAGSVSITNPGLTGERYSGILSKHSLKNDVAEFSIKKTSDTTPPDAIDNLIATSPTATSLTLNWTSTGDDGNTGQASSYDVRFSTFNINEANFEQAVPATDAPAPALSGTAESFVVSALQPGTQYNFALKIIDEAGNASAISNIASATTVAGNVVVDEFNRSTLGSEWTTAPDYAIVNNQLANTSLSDIQWNEMAVYNARKKPNEVSFKWGDNADAGGIDQGAFFIAVGAASANANGYAISRRTAANELRLWRVEDGEITSVVEKNTSPLLSAPQPGDVVKVQITVDEFGNRFDFYKNGVLDGRVEDTGLIHDMTGDYWVGVALRGNRNNDLDDFTILLELGTPSRFEVAAGDAQVDTVSQELPTPITVRVTDDAGSPIQGINVNFAVIAGGGSVDVAPPKDDIVIEAEQGVLNSPMVTATDANASKGQYIHVPDGGGGDAQNPGIATFTINIETAGNYIMWGRAIFPNANADAYKVLVDGTAYNWDIGQRIHQPDWTWDALTHRGSGSATNPELDPVVLNLTVGLHTIKIQEAKDGAKLDQFVITRQGSSFLPPVDQGPVEAGGTFTDATGEANTVWRIGPTPGLNQVQATATGFTPLTFSATGRAGRVTTITKVSGDNATGDRGQQLSQPFIVQLRDEFGNLAADAPTTWTVITGNGTLSSSNPVTTDAQGRAQSTLTLATDTGLNEVRVTAVGYTGENIIFTATPNPGAPSAITLHSGDGQVGTANSALATPLRVRVTDDIGTPVPNHSVTFAVTGGNGSVNPTSTTTGADGIAETVWTLGSEIGVVHQVQATAAGVPGSVTFSASVATPASFEAVSSLAHQGIAGIPLPDSIKIRVKDTLGKNLPGYPVEFSIVTLGGFEQGSVNGSTDPVTVHTGQDGIARVEWRLGPQAGTNNNKLRATATFNDSPINGAPIEFTSSAQIGSATHLVEVSGNNQGGFIEAQLAQPFVVQVTDGSNPVENWLVTFEMIEGGGKFPNGQSVMTRITDANGRASINYTLGSSAGTPQNPFNNVIHAIAENNNQALSGSPIIFRASALASSASTLARLGGDGQQGDAGQPLPQAIQVKVTDDAGNGIGTHDVFFKVTAGGGTINGETATEVLVQTSGNGVASVNWYLGGALGVNSQNLEVRADDGINQLSGSPMTFQATSIAGAVDPAVSTVTSDLSAVQANGIAKATITVTLTDKFGNPIPGKPVVLTSTGGGNVFAQPLTLTNASGQVTGTLASTVAELKTVSAQITGGISLTSSVDISFIPEPPERVTLNRGNNQTTNVGTAVQDPIEILVTDRFNNPVPGVNVRFEVTSGGGFILETNEPAPSESQSQANETVTNSEGKAWGVWILGSSPNTNTAIARAFFSNQELSGSPVTFTAIGVTASATRMEVHAGNNQVNEYAGFELPEMLEVKVTDNSGRPVSGVTVDFNVSLGGGTLSDTAPKSNHNGLARTHFTLGPSVGTNEVGASNSSLSGSPIIFRFESITGGPSKITIDSGDGGIATVNGALGVAMKITDLFDNPVREADTNFEVVQGGGSVLDSDAQTNSLGVARATILMPQNAGEVYVKGTADAMSGFFVTFRLQALPGSAAKLALYDGDGQEGTIGRSLVQPLQVQVTDQFDNPVSGVLIRWIGTIGGGSVSPAESNTDENGLAATSFSVGSQPGTNKAQAFSSISLNPSQIEFTAVGVANNFPIFTNLADQTVTEGSPLQFQVTAQDDDGDPISYEAHNLPPGASFSSNSATFGWTPSASQQGEYQVTFIARDNRNGLDSETITITVNNNNNPPQITAFEPSQAKLDRVWGSVIRFSVDVSDADGDQLTYLWQLFGPFVPNGQLLSTSQSLDFDTGSTEPATDSVRVIVSDGQDADTLSWEVSIFVSVELSSFSAEFAGFEGVKIAWGTSRETSNTGFDIFRSDSKDGEYTAVNTELIPPTEGGGLYEFHDTEVEAGRRYYYLLEDMDINGVRTEHGPIQVDAAAPETFAMSQNYPNPFNPETKIRYQLPKTTKVVIRIFDILGRQTRVLVEDRKEAGFHVATWNARNDDGTRVASGIYYFTISAGEFKMTKKMLLLK